MKTTRQAPQRWGVAGYKLHILSCKIMANGNGSNMPMRRVNKPLAITPLRKILYNACNINSVITAHCRCDTIVAKTIVAKLSKSLEIFFKMHTMDPRLAIALRNMWLFCHQVYRLYKTTYIQHILTMSC